MSNVELFVAATKHLVASFSPASVLWIFLWIRPGNLSITCVQQLGLPGNMPSVSPGAVLKRWIQGCRSRRTSQVKL